MIRFLLIVAVFEGLPLVVVGTTTYALATARGWMSVRERVLLSIAVALGVVSLVGAYGPDWLLQVVFSFAPGFVLIGGAAFIVASICLRRMPIGGRIAIVSLMAITVLGTVQATTLDGFDGTLCALILSDHTAYAPTYSASGFKQIQVGMAAGEVEALLGRPLDEWTIPGHPPRLYWRWSRSRDGSQYYRRRVVSFSDGRLADKSANFICGFD
jgi:hypothetical protein